jgi:alkylhydroperoxidase/carboxymuconolactone decarboxylase family protein YurZ
MSVSARTAEREWRLFAAWIQGDTAAARALLQSAPPPDGPMLREMLLMLHLFAGVPRMLEACAVVEGVCPGVLPPPDAEVAREGDAHERGGEVFEAVYGDKAPAVRDRLARYHPDIAHWVIGHAYGRVLGRAGLGVLDRELLAVAGLVALGTGPQLDSHVRGALRCGASRELVWKVVSCLKGRVSDAKWLAAASTVDERAT